MYVEDLSDLEKAGLQELTQPGVYIVNSINDLPDDSAFFRSKLDVSDVDFLKNTVMLGYFITKYADIKKLENTIYHNLDTDDYKWIASITIHQEEPETKTGITAVRDAIVVEKLPTNSKVSLINGYLSTDWFE